MAPGGQRFVAVRPMDTPGPGFAISLEPTGGMPEPTGAILFAVAPGI
jgi:anti-sigma-K factor RskA